MVVGVDEGRHEAGDSGGDRADGEHHLADRGGHQPEDRRGERGRLSVAPFLAGCREGRFRHAQALAEPGWGNRTRYDLI